MSRKKQPLNRFGMYEENTPWREGRSDPNKEWEIYLGPDDDLDDLDIEIEEEVDPNQ